MQVSYEYKHPQMGTINIYPCLASNAAVRHNFQVLFTAVCFI